MPDGSIVLVEIEGKTVTRIGPDGLKSVIARLDGGPNGAALGPDGALYICNNGGFLFGETDGANRTRPGAPEGYAGGWIERLDLSTLQRDILYTACDGQRLVGPNDLCLDGNGGFYFTDYGKIFPRYRAHGGLYYARLDGSQILEVAYPMTNPNGVGISPDGTTVYVAETETARLWAFDLEGPGRTSRSRSTPFAPHPGRIVVTMPGYQRFDSLAVDAVGNIHVATLVGGCVTIVSPDGRVLERIETGDPITTNICFGLEPRTAFVTLSGTGKLLRIDDYPHGEAR